MHEVLGALEDALGSAPLEKRKALSDTLNKAFAEEVPDGLFWAALFQNLMQAIESELDSNALAS